MDFQTIQPFIFIVFLLLLLFPLLQALQFLRLNSPTAHRQRAQAAETRGWMYTAGRLGRSLLYTVGGTSKEGIPWQIEAHRQRVTRKGSPNPGFAYTYWQAQILPQTANHQFLIMPHLPEPGRWLGPVYGPQFVLLSVLPPGTTHLASLPVVTAGTNSLHQRYTVRAADELAASLLLTSSVESQLLAWPFQPRNPWYAPMILLNEGSLQIRLLAAVYDLPTIEYLFNLGQTLLSAQMTR